MGKILDFYLLLRQMEIFDVLLSKNGIENYPEFFLENFILKDSQTHFSKNFYPRGGGGHF